ncbi:MAG: hypothetical protein K2M91_13520 [Lachnospiraceae bacterium]|nr:hypothetical protein [Lachnospiraceae bacterium]
MSANSMTDFVPGGRSVSLFTPKIDSSLLNKIFKCYDNTANVSNKEYLKEE